MRLCSVLPYQVVMLSFEMERQTRSVTLNAIDLPVYGTGRNHFADPLPRRILNENRNQVFRPSKDENRPSRPHLIFR